MGAGARELRAVSHARLINGLSEPEQMLQERTAHPLENARALELRVDLAPPVRHAGTRTKKTRSSVDLSVDRLTPRPADPPTSVTWQSFVVPIHHRAIGLRTLDA